MVADTLTRCLSSIQSIKINFTLWSIGKKLI